MDRIGDILYPKNAKPSSSHSDTPETGDAAAPRINPSDLRVLIVNMKKDLDQMLRILDGGLVGTGARTDSPQETEKKNEDTTSQTEQVIEGVFNGVKMISGDGSVYDVPPNYASKSKLVEGDMMKLTIPVHGKFVYKQIGPIDRQRIRGVLLYNESENQWTLVTSVGKSYKILTASVTFYKGKAKDEVIAFIPQNGHSEWAAVEHIISQ